MTIVKKIIFGVTVFIFGLLLINTLAVRHVDFPIEVLNHYRILYSILYVGAIIAVATMVIVEELRALKK